MGKFHTFGGGFLSKSFNIAGNDWLINLSIDRSIDWFNRALCLIGNIQAKQECYSNMYTMFVDKHIKYCHFWRNINVCMPVRNISQIFQSCQVLNTISGIGKREAGLTNCYECCKTGNNTYPCNSQLCGTPGKYHSWFVVKPEITHSCNSHLCGTHRDYPFDLL